MTTPAAVDFYWKRNDTAPPIICTLTDSNGNAVDITGSSVKFIMTAADANWLPATGTPKINASATINTPAGGVVQYQPTGTQLDTAGNFVGEWEVTYPSTHKQTYPDPGYLKILITADLDNA